MLTLAITVCFLAFQRAMNEDEMMVISPDGPL